MADDSTRTPLWLVAFGEKVRRRFHEGEAAVCKKGIHEAQHDQLHPVGNRVEHESADGKASL